MTEVEIRDATPGDAPGMADVWAAGIPYHVRTAASIRARMRYDGQLGRRRLVAILYGAMAGTAIVRHQPGGHARLELTVMPEHRNRGVGGRLLEEVLDWAAGRGAGTVVANANGDEESLGFATARLPELVAIELVAEAAGILFNHDVDEPPRRWGLALRRSKLHEQAIPRKLHRAEFLQPRP